MRVAKAILLSQEERTTLTKLSRGRSAEARVVLRARIVLACQQDRTDVEIARALRIMRQTVGKWRRRFQSARLEGLLDEPRPGAPLACSRTAPRL